MKMKKIVSITFVLLLIISLCSCKKKQSGITIENFYENAIKYIDDDLTPNINKTKDGFSFQFADDSSTGNAVGDFEYEYSGKADKEKNINLIIVKVKNVNIEYFNNCTAEDIASIIPNYAEISPSEIYKIETAFLFMNLQNILTIFSNAETKEARSVDFLSLFAARFSERDINGWKILITTNENENSVTFTAKFDN